MNRLFLLLFGIMYVVSLIRFLLKRKLMLDKQQRVISVLYALTFILAIALQFQYTHLLPTGFLINYLSPRMKMWIDHVQ